jgi:hypothetical protein
MAQELAPIASPLGPLRAGGTYCCFNNISDRGATAVMAEREPFTWPFALAPTRIFLSPAQQFSELGIRGGPTRLAALGEGPLAAGQITVPAPDSVGLEQAQPFGQLGFGAAS